MAQEGAAGIEPTESRIQVRVFGIEDRQQRQNVLELLPLYRHRERTDLTEGDVLRFHARSGPAIRRGLEPFGYYNPIYTAELEATDQGWRASYQVKPGPRTLIEDVDIRIIGLAADLPALTAWQEAFPLAERAPLEHLPYDQAMRDLERLAREHGLYDSRFTHRAIEVDPDEERARIVVHFETGARYQLGHALFEGSQLRNDFLQRFVGHRPGDPFEADALLQLQRDLIDTGYFSRVEVVPRPGVGTEVPIHVRLVDRPPTRYTAGIGYGTDTGPRVRGGIERRYLNRRGHRAGITTALSTVQQELTTWYTIPFGDPRHEAITTQLSRSETTTPTSEQTVQKGQVALTQARKPWLRTLAVAAEHEDYTIGSESGNSRLLMPRIGWESLPTRRRASPGQQPYRLALDIRGADDNWFSDTTFTQARARARKTFSLDGEERHRLVNRVDLGATQVDDIRELPASLRFFVGGDRSIRGFRYQSLGPENAEGDIIGGEHLAVWGLDYEYGLRGNWAAALFHDVGTAFGPGSPDVRRGAGTGIRWYLPVGALALDIARPLEASSRWRLHLTLRAEL